MSKYSQPINISYIDVNQDGVLSIDSPYYVASSPNLCLTATGSTYETALDNLLLLVASVSTFGY
jgi:hypothetical protein